MAFKSDDDAHSTYTQTYCLFVVHVNAPNERMSNITKTFINAQKEKYEEEEKDDEKL